MGNWILIGPFLLYLFCIQLSSSSSSSDLPPQSQDLADVSRNSRHFIPLMHFCQFKSKGNCLADLCGAIHCDLVMDSQPKKTKCNPAAAVKNRHLCEKVADNCFPVSGGPSASRLHEFFLRQFCDAHSCSGGVKSFSRGGKRHTGIFYIAISVLILMLLPIFYGFVYMYQRGLKTSTQELGRVSQTGSKKKPS